MARYVDNGDISELVRELETNFISGGGTLMSKYVTSDLYEDINKIYAYLDSKFIEGERDSLGRKKPFFNISVASRNIYYRATDLDRKNINVKATKRADVIPAFLATVHIQDWMRKQDFGTFLNKWGIELAAFNSSVVKFVEDDGELHAMVVPWSRLIVDQINFDANPKIEILELTEGELYKRKGYDKEMVQRLCDALASRELTDHSKKDQKNNYIKLYEVHGLLPLSYLTGKESDTDKFEQQMHIVSFVESKQKGDFDDFTLYSGREEQDPYMLTSLLPSTDGSISLDGSVKRVFQAQWMLNHTMKSIKDQLDISSKLIFQTADPNFVGRNALTAIEQGDILVHGVNMPLTQVNNGSHDITAQQGFGNMWKALSSEMNGISESMLGNTAPSGTAWRQVEALLNESHSLFQLMTENKGLDVERMFRRYVIPFIKKKMDTSKEIGATLEAHQITKIDSMYVPYEAARRFNKQLINKILSPEFDEEISKGEYPAPYQKDAQEQPVRDELAPLGNQRFFVPSDIDDRTWKEALKQLEWELEVDITAEQTDNQAVMATLNTALQVTANPQFANNPHSRLIIDKLLTTTGVVSPIELAQLPAPTQQPEPLPVAQ